jgi:tetratricopeptide (TPR) repeat protein
MPNRHRIAIALATLTFFAAALPGQAAGQGTPPGPSRALQPWRDLIAQGNALYQLDRFAEALALYEKAHVLRPTPTTLHNIAQCLRGLKQYARAIKAFQAYLAAAPGAANRADVESLLLDLGNLLATERQAEQARPSVVMADPEPGARSASPLPAAVAPVTPAAGVLPTASVARVATPEAADARPPIYKRWWFWTLVGAVVTGAAVGVGVGVTRCPAHAVCP